MQNKGSIEQKYCKQLESIHDSMEKGNFVESKKLYEELVANIESELSETSADTDKRFYIKAKSYYIICLRLIAQATFEEIIRVGKDLYEYDQKNGLNTPEGIKAVSNSYANLGMMEFAESLLERRVELETEYIEVADALAHLAFCNYRMSNINKAEENLEKAFSLVDEKARSSEPYESVFSYMLLIKGMFRYSEQKYDEAAELFTQGLAVAESKSVSARIRQAKALIELTKNKKLLTESKL